jgi:hypothetical protein
MPPPALLMRPLAFDLGPRAAGGTGALARLPGVTDAAARAIPLSADAIPARDLRHSAIAIPRLERSVSPQ